MNLGLSVTKTKPKKESKNSVTKSKKESKNSVTKSKKESKKSITKPKKESKKKSVESETEVVILEHNLTPLHEKVLDDQVESIMSKYNVSLSQLPKISGSDPAIKHLEVKSGDIIKIERASPTSGRTIYYRMVIDQ